MSLDRLSAGMEALTWIYRPMFREVVDQRRTFLGLTALQWRVWHGHACGRFREMTEPSKRLRMSMDIENLRAAERLAADGWDQQPLSRRWI